MTDDGRDELNQHLESLKGSFRQTTTDLVKTFQQVETNKTKVDQAIYQATMIIAGTVANLIPVFEYFIKRLDQNDERLKAIEQNLNTISERKD